MLIEQLIGDLLAKADDKFGMENLNLMFKKPRHTVICGLGVVVFTIFAFDAIRDVNV